MIALVLSLFGTVCALIGIAFNDDIKLDSWIIAVVPSTAGASITIAVAYLLSGILFV